MSFLETQFSEEKHKKRNEVVPPLIFSHLKAILRKAQLFSVTEPWKRKLAAQIRAENVCH